MVVVVAAGAARRGAGMAGVAARSTGTAGGCTAGVVVAAAAARSTAPRRPTLTSQQPTHSTCETNIDIRKQTRYYLRKYFVFICITVYYFVRVYL